MVTHGQNLHMLRRKSKVKIAAPQVVQWWGYAPFFRRGVARAELLGGARGQLLLHGHQPTRTSYWLCPPRTGLWSRCFQNKHIMETKLLLKVLTRGHFSTQEA